jgi:hypothetical protein
MTVVYPRKFNNNMSARDILKRVVGEREIHLITLNRYRYNEQRSCKDLTELIEKLNGKPRELLWDLSRHVADEARHAMWLTDLLVDLGADISTPPGMSYINELERLLDLDIYETTGRKEDSIIAALASINVTEKRGCEYFAAHLYVLDRVPQTEENLKIKETIAKILPEEAAHVRWGNRWLAQIAKQSPENSKKVALAKIKYGAIEQAAYEAGMDITAGAELRRVSNLVDIANTMPVWARPQYLMERLPQAVLAPELQFTRFKAAQRYWQKDPQAFMEKFVPMFLNGLKKEKNLN